MKSAEMTLERLDSSDIITTSGSPDKFTFALTGVYNDIAGDANIAVFKNDFFDHDIKNTGKADIANELNRILGTDGITTSTKFVSGAHSLTLGVLFTSNPIDTNGDDGSVDDTRAEWYNVIYEYMDKGDGYCFYKQ